MIPLVTLPASTLSSQPGVGTLRVNRRDLLTRRVTLRGRRKDGNRREAVPLVFETTPGTRLLYLVDTLYSDGRGSFVHTHLIGVDSLVGSYRSIRRTDDNGRYAVSHDTVFFQCVDPYCDLPSRGIFLPNGDLSLVSAPYGPWSVYTPLR